MRTIPTVLLLAIASLPAVAQRPTEREAGKPAPARADDGFEHLDAATRTFESEALGRETAYTVLLPAEYGAEENAEKRYPLVVWLHGMFEDHERFLERGGAEVLDEMLGDGRMPPCVFVCAEGDRASFWLDAGKGRDYETMVVRDLLADVEEHYRIDSDRRMRALMGVSMGGYGALKIAFKEPERFGIVAAHSAAVLPKDPTKLEDEYAWLRGERGKGLLGRLFGEPLDEDKWRAENVLVLAEERPIEALSTLAIYFDCGDADRYGFQKRNLTLHETLEEREIAHTWRLVEGGGHGWQSGYNSAALPHSLGFVAQHFTAERGRSGLRGLLGPADK